MERPPARPGSAPVDPALSTVAAPQASAPPPDPPARPGLEPTLASEPTQGRASVPPGTTFGRYEVIERLGAGGMGVVYAAYDPELARRVALKLLRVEHSTGADTGEGLARLLREAQAMARVQHENVIAVHDVGTLGDQVFIAMELIG
jgi:serine/threonine protein kinase